MGDAPDFAGGAAEDFGEAPVTQSSEAAEWAELFDDNGRANSDATLNDRGVVGLDAVGSAKCAEVFAVLVGSTQPEDDALGNGEFAGLVSSAPMEVPTPDGLGLAAVEAGAQFLKEDPDGIFHGIPIEPDRGFAEAGNFGLVGVGHWGNVKVELPVTMPAGLSRTSADPQRGPLSF